MEHPERKPNRLAEYDYTPNGAYFVTICTQDRRNILSNIVGDGFPVPCKNIRIKPPEALPAVIFCAFFEPYFSPLFPFFR